MPIDQERARRLIAQCLAVDEDRVIDSARLVEDLDADSLEIAEDRNLARRRIRRLHSGRRRREVAHGRRRAARRRSLWRDRNVSPIYPFPNNTPKG